jgi:hypothetical protein
MSDPFPLINIDFKILEFGHANIETKGRELESLDKVEQAPAYSEPKTTDESVVEIIFGGADYIIPKTTSGLL